MGHTPQLDRSQTRRLHDMWKARYSQLISRSPALQRPSSGARRFASTANPKPRYNPTDQLGSPDQSLSLTQRFRKLSREYGYGALGVYFLLSAADFPICFLAVRTLGADRIGEWEHQIVGFIKSVLPPGVMDAFSRAKKAVYERAGLSKGTNEPPPGWGVEEAEKANKGDYASKCIEPALSGQPLMPSGSVR